MNKKERLNKDREREAKKIYQDHFIGEFNGQEVVADYVDNNPWYFEPEVPPVVPKLTVEDVVIKKAVIDTPETPEQVREGVWQYLIDHSHFTETGNLRVAFVIRNKENFWRRCNSRISGQYRRYNLKEIEEKLEKDKESRRRDFRHTSLQSHAQEYNARKAVANLQVVERIRQGNNYLDKLKLWCYRKLRNNLFPRVSK